jgi:hypothetical protein
MTFPVFSAQSATGYNLTRSLRFRRSGPSYLSRSFSSGDRRAWTWSAWVKRGVLSTDNSTIFDTNSSVGGATRGGIKFRDDCLYINQNPTGSSQTCELKSTAVFRDIASWYHVVVVWDTAQATAANRVKMYINGVQITSFQISTYPGQNTDSALNGNTTHKLGTDGPNISGEAFDGYLAEVNFIGGQALTPSSFGAINASTGEWQPKAYTGSYSGTNSYYLPFTNNASTTTLGNDFSGNGNNWTPNNISLTTGATYDSMTDVPTNTSATVANYCVLNPLDKSQGSNVITDANLKTSYVASGRSLGTIFVNSGKWYAEFNIGQVSSGNADAVGVCGYGTSSSVVRGYAQDGRYYNGSSWSSYGASYTGGDIIGVAYDSTNQTLEFYKNNSSQGQKTSIGLTFATFVAWVEGASGNNISANFGQRPFAYTPPTGFVALNTFNLPTPTIGVSGSTLANRYMDISLYTGTGSARSVTGLNFQPDWVWIKERSSTSQHALFDAVRGVQKRIITDSTAAEDTSAQLLTAFNSDGFSVGTDGAINENSQTYVAWNWKANGAGSSNTNGSITSTVSVNTSSGFSIATMTTQASGTATFGHGLGVAPSMVICKFTSTSSDWYVWHSSFSGSQYVLLNTTGAVTSNSAIFSSAPTSTVVNLGSAWAGGGRIVSYCFSEIPGYSKFGTYTGNGSSDGPFVFTGFSPRYILFRRTDSAGGAAVADSARNPLNVAGQMLYPYGSDAEGTNPYCDFLSNGFKVRGTSLFMNASGGSYIYMAFAENPYKYSLAR